MMPKTTALLFLVGKRTLLLRQEITFDFSEVRVCTILALLRINGLKYHSQRRIVSLRDVETRAI
jgi:hypothetical protein